MRLKFASLSVIGLLNSEKVYFSKEIRIDNISSGMNTTFAKLELFNKDEASNMLLLCFGCHKSLWTFRNVG